MPKNDVTPPGGAPISTEGTRSLYRVEAVERKLRMYGVQEGELQTLGTLNTLVTVFMSLGTGLLGYSLSLFVDLAMGAGADSDSLGFIRAVRTVVFVASIVCYLVGFVMLWRRHSTLEVIKSESRS